MSTSHNLGPKNWSDSFLASVASRKDDNHHAEVNESMVETWHSNLDAVSTVCADKLKSAIEIANAN
jgi:hypothetical protein